MDIVNNIWFAIGEFFWNMNSRLALLYLASTVVIAFVIWLSKGRPVTFLKWLIPAAVYRHKSNLLDIKIFLFNSVLMLGGFFCVGQLYPDGHNRLAGSFRGPQRRSLYACLILTAAQRNRDGDYDPDLGLL